MAGPIAVLGSGAWGTALAAHCRRGGSVVRQWAREPEVADLAHCLVAMGAKIEGIGTDTLTIRGVEGLGGTEYAIVPDRIETGTYAVAAAISGGDLTLQGARATLSKAVIEFLTGAGVEITETNDGIRVARANGPLRGVDLITEPYPGFPTDMQAQAMALMAVAEGASMITETIFENRFMHVPELFRMGADINVHGASAIVRGVGRLSGAPVMATDLRASVSLVLALFTTTPLHSHVADTNVRSPVRMLTTGYDFPLLARIARNVDIDADRVMSISGTPGNRSQPESSCCRRLTGFSMTSAGSPMMYHG